MGKFEGILICSDLDGTLLNEDFKVSKENAEAIEYFKSEGGYFTFITGRMPYYARDIYEMAHPNAPIGCSNGAAVYDFERGEYLWSREMDKSALKFLEIVERELPELGFNINTYHEVLYCRESSAMKFIRDVTGMPNTVRDFREVQEPFIKIVFGHKDRSLIDRLEEMLKQAPWVERFDALRAGFCLYEMQMKGIHKGIVLPILAAHLGIDEKKIIAVGDQENDLGMIKAAHLGIAVENASEAVKKVADRVTVHHRDHAIAKIISELDCGKILL